MFDGVWQSVGGKLGTASIPVPETRLTISGSAYAVEVAGQIERGRLEWDVAVEPTRVRMIGTAGDHAGHVVDAIMRVRGTIMQLCYAVDGGTRPGMFAEAETRPAIVTVRYRQVESLSPTERE